MGGQKIRLFVPKGRRTPAAMLWIHGGGRVMGSLKYMDRHCIRLAQNLGITAATASYRVGPKHPFPAALDDCVAAWRWMSDQAADLGVDPARMAVGGESAGGGLAAELVQRVHDEGGTQPACQVLVYPMLDDRTAVRPELTEQRHLVWNNRSNHFGWKSYLGVEPGSEDVGAYAAAARRADLGGLPPAWLTVGDLDLFLDEILHYVARLEQSDVDVEIARIEGGFHGYFSVGEAEPPIAEMWDGLEAFLQRHLGL